LAGRSKVPNTAELREIKRRLSDRLLEIPGVSGVGIPAGRFTVYLEQDTRDVRERVIALLNAEAPGMQVDFIVTDRLQSGS
jgi:hypothetical protein